MYLLDTNVVSELRKPKPHGAVAQWIDGMPVAYREWARLMNRASDTLNEDAMNAATAHVHKLTVVTRNVADSKHFGVEVLNPILTARKWRECGDKKGIAPSSWFEQFEAAPQVPSES